MNLSTNENLNSAQSRSQAIEILRALQAGQKLTPIEALNRFGCFRLGARIYDLKKQGFSIKSKMVETQDGKRVAEYSLANAI